MSNYTDEWLWKKAAYSAVWNWLPPFVIPFGLVSNACAFVVLLQPRLRAMVVHLPLIVLSLVDSLALLTGLARHWLRKATYFTENFGNRLDPQAQCEFCCKFLELLLYVSLMYSSWIIVIVAAERFVAICAAPSNRARARLISRKGLWLALLCSLAAVLLTNLHFVFTRSLQDNGTDGDRHCSNLPQHQVFVEAVFPRIDLALTAFIPFTVIAVCNISIIVKLHRVRRSSMLSRKTGSYRTTVMLLLTTFMFVVLTSPVKLYLTIVGGPHPAELHPSEYYSYRLVWSCVLVLQFSNHCCNFLLYCLSNPQFRQEAERLLLRCCSGWQLQQEMPHSNCRHLSSCEHDTRL